MRIAVIGTGTIGHMVGGYLSYNGYDVTLVSQFRRETAQKLSRLGIRVAFGNETFHTDVRAVYWADLAPQERFDAVLLTGSADFTADAVHKMKPYAADGAFWSSFQNGIPEDVIVPIVGRENVIPVVCYAGGRVAGTGQVVTHDGYLIIGEMDGSDTERLHAFASVLSCIRRVELSDDIMSQRWSKLTMAVAMPVRIVSGSDALDDPVSRACMARCAVEFGRLAASCGAHPQLANGVPFDRWSSFVNGPPDEAADAYLTQAFSTVFAPSREELGDMAVRIPHMDLAGDLVPDVPLPMEGHQTMGYLIKKSAQLSLPMPMYEYLYPFVVEVSYQRLSPGISILEKGLRETDQYYKNEESNGGIYG